MPKMPSPLSAVEPHSERAEISGVLKKLDVGGVLNLHSSSIRRLLEGGFISRERAIRLTVEERERLELVCLFTLILNGHTTVDRVLLLRDGEVPVIESEELYFLILAGKLTLDQMLELDEYDLDVLLEQPIVRELIHRGWMPYEDALTLSVLKIEAIELVEKAIFYDRSIDLNDVISLSYDKLNLFVDTGVSLEDLWAISEEETEKLMYNPVRDLLASNIINVKQALALTERELEILSYASISSLVHDDILMFDELRALSDDLLERLLCSEASKKAMINLFTLRNHLVRSVSLDYFSKHETAIAMLSFARCEEKDRIKMIWPKIKTKVLDRMMEQFSALVGQLFDADHQDDLNDFIEGGVHADSFCLDVKQASQEDMSVTDGYQAFCRYTLFERPTLSACISPDKQEAFDRRYGLVPYKGGLAF